MKLDHLQYKVLKAQWRYHTCGLTIGQILRTCWVRWLFLIALILLSYFFVVPNVSWAGRFYIGLCIGALARDIGSFRIAYRIWPVNREIVDWERVAAIIASHEKSNAERDGAADA